RAVRSARRRIAGQLLLDRLAIGCAIALVAGLLWLLVEPGAWWVGLSLLILAAFGAVIRTIRDYPAPLDAALELDCRFALRERITAAVELPLHQRETPVGRAVVADAEEHASGLRVGEKFPLRLRRSTALVPLFAALLAVFAFVWNPITDWDLFTGEQ